MDILTFDDPISPHPDVTLPIRRESSRTEQNSMGTTTLIAKYGEEIRSIREMFYSTCKRSLRGAKEIVKGRQLLERRTNESSGPRFFLDSTVGCGATGCEGPREDVCSSD